MEELIFLPLYEDGQQTFFPSSNVGQENRIGYTSFLQTCCINPNLITNRSIDNYDQLRYIDIIDNYNRICDILYDK